MSDHEIRMQCLQLAVAVRPHLPERNTTDIAKAYYEFVMGCDKDRPEATESAVRK